MVDVGKSREVKCVRAALWSHTPHCVCTSHTLHQPDRWEHMTGEEKTTCWTPHTLTYTHAYTHTKPLNSPEILQYGVIKVCVFTWRRCGVQHRLSKPFWQHDGWAAWNRRCSQTAQPEITWHNDSHSHQSQTQCACGFCSVVPLLAWSWCRSYCVCRRSWGFWAKRSDLSADDPYRLTTRLHTLPTWYPLPQSPGKREDVLFLHASSVFGKCPTLYHNLVYHWHFCINVQ